MIPFPSVRRIGLGILTTGFATGFLVVSTIGVAAEKQMSDQVAHGAELFAVHCAVCHGDDGMGGAGFPSPVWGERSQIRKFSHGRGLFEYNAMMMPFDDPSKMDMEEKLAVTAYLLANHGAMDTSDTIAADNAIDVPIE
ncbi:MAG: cytochrome c [Salinarimonas sp.]|nr:cytochrome c [Salinarimonas sp.]